ncbi:HER216Wp [Eremothecium sinecaudum]|uniref:HER216Wp n=1 Tax=Eremothecium sinecaudum TaxID=45286 RepID=A0A0X8HU19_9SACH|nr:HER216Wp [Eremothecium sinecaudum]AMD21494.1 HER216Wp [Eremothecium sinecaudum]
MGNDGGSITRSKGLAITAIKGSNVATDDNTGEYAKEAKWSTCRLSNSPLQLPLVSDFMGNLLNKEAVLEWLLDSQHKGYTAKQVEMFKHIKRLKDVVDLHNLTVVPESNLLRCEVGDEVLGRSKGGFVYSSRCGDVFPQKLRLQVESCPVCGKDYDKQDIIPLNPTSSSELDFLQSRMETLKKHGLTHSGKPLSKRQKRSQSPSAKSPGKKRKL